MVVYTFHFHARAQPARRYFTLNPCNAVGLSGGHVQDIMGRKSGIWRLETMVVYTFHARAQPTRRHFTLNPYNAAGVMGRKSGIWWLYLKSTWKMHSDKYKHAWYWLKYPVNIWEFKEDKKKLHGQIYSRILSIKWIYGIPLHTCRVRNAKAVLIEIMYFRISLGRDKNKWGKQHLTAPYFN